MEIWNSLLWNALIVWLDLTWKLALCNVCKFFTNTETFFFKLWWTCCCSFSQEGANSVFRWCFLQISTDVISRNCLLNLSVQKMANYSYDKSACYSLPVELFEQTTEKPTSVSFPSFNSTGKTIFMTKHTRNWTDEFLIRWFLPEKHQQQQQND